MTTHQTAHAFAARGPHAGNTTRGFRQVQTRRTFEEVAAQVREMLFGGALHPGDRLPPERELALILGVGRPALREALRALEVGGLIELRKGKTGGAFISSGSQRVVSAGMSDMLRLSGVPISELFEAREWMLSSLVRPVCARITAEEVAALRDNIDRAEQLHAQGRFAERISTNFEFYAMLARATRNSVAEMVVRGLTDSLLSLIEEVGSDLSPGFFSQRRRLLQAIEARDEAAAAERVAAIVKATEQTYKRLAESRLKESARALAASPASAATPVAAPVPAAAKAAPAKRAPRKVAAKAVKGARK